MPEAMKEDWDPTIKLLLSSGHLWLQGSKPLIRKHIDYGAKIYL